MLFYPVGLSLDYNTNNLIQRTLLWMFQSTMGTSNAFSLIYLLIVIATALSAYIYVNYLFKDRWLALFAAVVFGFSQHVIGHASHPMLNLLSTIPLTLYALQRGIEERRLKWMLLSGFFCWHYCLCRTVYICLSIANIRIISCLLYLLEMASATILGRDSSIVWNCCFDKFDSYLSFDPGHFETERSIRKECWTGKK